MLYYQKIAKTTCFDETSTSFDDFVRTFSGYQIAYRISMISLSWPKRGLQQNVDHRKETQSPSYPRVLSETKRAQEPTHPRALNIRGHVNTWSNVAVSTVTGSRRRR